MATADKSVPPRDVMDSSKDIPTSFGELIDDASSYAEDFRAALSNDAAAKRGSAGRHLPDMSVGDSSPPEGNIRQASPPPEGNIRRALAGEQGCGASSDRAALTTADMQRLFDRNFNRLDKDGNGFVSQDEIEQAMHDRSFKGDDAIFVTTLHKNWQALAQENDDGVLTDRKGISKEDMTAFDGLQRADRDADVVKEVRNTLASSQNRLEYATCREAFADSGHPEKSITAEAIRQGNTGDCYFLAALGSMAESNPRAVANMIKDNGNGTYTVTFPGDPENPVTVKAPTEAEMATYQSGSQYGTWPAILEKAYAKHEGGSYSDIDGSLTHAGVRILSTGGTDTNLVSLSSNEEIDEKLEDAFRDGVPVTASVRGQFSKLLPGGKNRTDDGLQGNHEYSVVGYDSKTGKIKLRNPWGHDEPTNADGTAKDGVNDGVFTMTLDEFRRNFSEISYGKV